MIGIVVSRADEASVHIADHVLDLGDFEQVAPDAYRADGFEMRTFEDLHIHVDDAAAAFDEREARSASERSSGERNDPRETPDVVVFVSRHSGDTGPLLSAHYTGNFGSAKYGGSDRSLAPACPTAHRDVVAALRDHAPEQYDVAMECTHHGPTSVGAPSMFVELGSTESEWQDEAGARAVARAVLSLQRTGTASEPEDADRTLVAFGGGHYAPRPTRILADTDWRVGHVAADWSLDELGDPREHPDVVEATFEASGARYAVVDGEQPDLESVIADLGYTVVSETWVRETDGVPLPTVDALEAAVCTVDDGLRFGERARDYDDGFLVVDLPAELLDAAHAADAEAAVAAAARTALAFGTDEAGNRLAGPAAFPTTDAYRAFVDRVAGVLETDYDDVQQTDGELVAERETFDPAAASKRGVPEGPKFGRLAAGESVDVDGKTVQPEAVAKSERMTVSVAPRERTRERVRRPSDAEGKGN